MKRLGAALLLLAALCAVSTICSGEVAEINNRALEGVKNVTRLAESDALDEARAAFEETAAEWMQGKSFLEALLHHETIEHAEELFASCQKAFDVGKEVFLMEAAKLERTLGTLAKGDEAGAGNIF